MAKNIVFCADGTWDKPGQTRHGLPADTNVVSLFRATVRDATQVVEYDSGIGALAQGFWRVFDGVFATGLARKVKDGYRFIAENYEPGDRIYLFGFSRGAYTVRSIAGMIAAAGVPARDKVSRGAVRDAFKLYRMRSAQAAGMQKLEDKYGNRPADIHMIGVWDTVGALGIPMHIFAPLDHLIYGFYDTALSITTRNAYQALAIDEHRLPYRPALWDPLSPAALAAGNKMEQVWFAGTHGDVGGGTGNQAGLASITLAWMMRKALECGIKFDASAYVKSQEVKPAAMLAPIHPTWSPLMGPPIDRAIDSAATLADSVAMRIAATPAYRPGNLFYAEDGGPARRYRIAQVMPLTTI